MADVDKKIGENLRRIRKSKRMGQVELAGLSGVSQGGISAIELGKREAYPSTLDRLAAALDVPVAAFFEGEEAPKVPPLPKTPLTSYTPEEIEKRLYGAPAAEISGELRPVLSEAEAREFSDAARRERDAVDEWIRQYESASGPERFSRRADRERVKDLARRVRFYHDWLFNTWSLLANPRPAKFKSARQFAGEQVEAGRKLLEALENEAEKQRIERSGRAG